MSENKADSVMGEYVASDAILTSQQQKIAAGVERHAPSKLRVFMRAYNGAASKREAIKAKCLDCSSLVVAEVRNCTATGCPLWRYRPYQSPRKARNRQKENDASATT